MQMNAVSVILAIFSLYKPVCLFFFFLFQRSQRFNPRINAIIMHTFSFPSTSSFCHRNWLFLSPADKPHWSPICDRLLFAPFNFSHLFTLHGFFLFTLHVSVHLMLKNSPDLFVLWPLPHLSFHIIKTSDYAVHGCSHSVSSLTIS